MAQITIAAGTPQQITLAPGTPITIAGNAVAFGQTSAGANAYATAPQIGGGYLTMATPASGNPVSATYYQNTTNQAYTATISSGSGISAITVNGYSVGTAGAGGAFVVPAYGSIAVTWTVTQPTWVWTVTQAWVTDTAWPGIFINFGTETFWVGVAAASGNATISYPS